jgi:hypothetical protein
MRPALIVIILSGMQGAALSDDAVPAPQQPDPDPGGQSITETPAPPPAGTPRWPRGVIDRPLTLPGQLVVGGADVLGLNTRS